MNHAEVIQFNEHRQPKEVRMADLDNGYTRLANELYEELIGAPLTANQAKVVHAICRKTYGFGKKQDRISDSQIAELTKLPRQKVNQIKNKLIDMNILLKIGNQIGINKTISEWKLEKSSKVLPAKKSTSIINNDTEMVTENKKEVVTKMETKNVTKMVTGSVTKMETHKRKLKKKENISNTNVLDIRDDSMIEVLNYLNKVTGSKFKKSKDAQSINARIAEGYTIEQIKLVIDFKYADWKDDLNYSQYLRPYTLFHINKFSTYLKGGENWVRQGYPEKINGRWVKSNVITPATNEVPPGFLNSRPDYQAPVITQEDIDAAPF